MPIFIGDSDYTYISSEINDMVLNAGETSIYLVGRTESDNLLNGVLTGSSLT